MQDEAHKASHVQHLRNRLLEELQGSNCLAALLICEALHLDMDEERWLRDYSLCELYLNFGMGSNKLLIDPDDIRAQGVECLGMGDLEVALMAARACLALAPDDALCLEFYGDVARAFNNPSTSESS
ncbi:hypothetical protein ACP4OV_005965 [Aristida adscensionis]